MATGTGKTYTAFQIIWRLWKSGAKKRILFLADRNILVDQTKTNDFKPFGQAMTKITKRQVDKSYEIYLSLYQAVTGTEEEKNIYKQFSPDFFDLVVVDECHRGSAAEDSAWREILDYFSSRHPDRPDRHAQGNQGRLQHPLLRRPDLHLLAAGRASTTASSPPTRSCASTSTRTCDGWRPRQGKTDKYGQLIEDRIYNQKDFDRNLVLEKRTELVAAKITEFLKATDRYDKTIVFCEDIDHAERMRQALVNAQRRAASPRTASTSCASPATTRKARPSSTTSSTPRAATRSSPPPRKLMTTGVDAQTCKLIVLDQRIQSMTEFKQIIGRGTRINEDYGKFYFTIMDFKKATELFADPDFDGDPVQIYEPGPDDPPVPPTSRH